MLQKIVLNSFIGFAYGHSWADDVGGGSYRGAQGANDLVKQRYYCPFTSLAQCQPPASTGVVLTPANQRPCRTDLTTPTWGSGVAGQPMYIHWAGNGHTGAKSSGTCVSIFIAPYSLDPDFNEFRKLASCLPFSHDADITDAYVSLPVDLPSGRYTVFWLWDFAPFWFSSCSDINVSGSAGPTSSPRPSTSTKPPVTSSVNQGATTRITTIQSMTASPPTSTVDCKRYDRPNAVCQSLYGASSYCMSWVSDKCGRSNCLGAPALNDSNC